MTTVDTGSTAAVEAANNVAAADDTVTTTTGVISEKDVGITQFAGDHKGFFGIIKQRFSDFLVNELSADGIEVHLTDTKTIPVYPTAANDEEKVQGDADDDTEEEDLPQGLTQDTCKSLKELVKNPSSDGHEGGKINKDCVLIDVTDLSKNERKVIHVFVFKKYPTLMTITGDHDGAKVIKVVAGSEAALKLQHKRRSGPRQHTHFLLYKENMDTMEAASRLAARLHVQTQSLGYAGTKDRRGKTVQRFSVPAVEPQRIMDAVASMPRMTVGNFSYQPRSITLGQLGGNMFKIVLREVKGEDEDIMSAVNNVKQHGVLNYYGMQRFGTHTGHTHDVGKHLLCSEWDEAIRTILKPWSSDRSDMRSNILSMWQSNSITTSETITTLKRAGITGGVEMQLLMGLQTSGDQDKVGAIGKIPRNTRILYLHAYQSYLWNRIVSKRVEKYGLKVLPGDLIVAAREPGTEGDAEDVPAVETGDLDPDCVHGPDANSDPAAATDNTTNSAIDSAKLSKLQGRLRVVTPEEVDDILLSQVMIPAIGYAVRMPDNEIADWYTEMLAEDNLTIKNFNHTQKSFSVAGAYRAMMLTPKHVSCEICHYTDPHKSLLCSDVDKLDAECAEKKTEQQKQDKTIDITEEVTTTDEKCNSDIQIKDSTTDQKEQTDDDQSMEVTTQDPDTETEIKMDSSVPKENGAEDDCKMDTTAAQEPEATNGDIEETTTEQECVSRNDKTDEPAATEEAKEESSAPDKSEANNMETEKPEDSTTPTEATPQQHKAVIIQFSLTPAAYATMVLREILKMDTGSQYHASLNSEQQPNHLNNNRTEDDGSNRGSGRGNRGSGRGHRDGGRGNRGGGGYGNRGRGFGNRGGGHGNRGGGYGNRDGGYGNRGGGYGNRGGGNDSRGGGYGKRGGGYGNREGGHGNRGGGFSNQGGEYGNRGRGFNKRPFTGHYEDASNKKFKPSGYF